MPSSSERSVVRSAQAEVKWPFWTMPSTCQPAIMPSTTRSAAIADSRPKREAKKCGASSAAVSLWAGSSSTGSRRASRRTRLSSSTKSIGSDAASSRGQGSPLEGRV